MVESTAPTCWLSVGVLRAMAVCPWIFSFAPSSPMSMRRFRSLRLSSVSITKRFVDSKSCH